MNQKVVKVEEVLSDAIETAETIKREATARRLERERLALEYSHQIEQAYRILRYDQRHSPTSNS